MSTPPRRHDLIVVGGGIYGVCVALESARRGLQPLLLERHGFGGATSVNHQRIIHGGLRYLQSLDVKRTLESAAEQRWFQRHFPDLVTPLSCLMPLYGPGWRSPWALRGAFAVYGLLTGNRGAGRVLSSAETCGVFPGVRRAGLKGAAMWREAVMVNSHKLLSELLGWAVACGATAQDNRPVERLIVEDGKTRGVESGGSQFHADVVVNCAGPWSRVLAATLDRDIPRLMHPSLGFCVLVNHTPLSSAALAVARAEPGSRTYFLVPWRGRVLVGTGHAAWSGALDHPAPTEAQLRELLDDVHAAIPSFLATPEHVAHVFCGILPAARADSPETAARPVVAEHARYGGPSGLWSVSGVKYTTARRVAEQLVRDIFGNRPYRANTDRPATSDRDIPPIPAEAALQT